MGTFKITRARASWPIGAMLAALCVTNASAFNDDKIYAVGEPADAAPPATTYSIKTLAELALEPDARRATAEFDVHDYALPADDGARRALEEDSCPLDCAAHADVSAVRISDAAALYAAREEGATVASINEAVSRALTRKVPESCNRRS